MVVVGFGNHLGSSKDWGIGSDVLLIWEVTPRDVLMWPVAENGPS